MVSEWREYRIGEIAEIVGGSTPSTADRRTSTERFLGSRQKIFQDHMSVTCLEVSGTYHGRAWKVAPRSNFR